MKSLPQGSSPGPDLLGNEFYAIHRERLAGPLTEALNYASSTGTLPETMLQGSISVLYKKKDRRDIRNYRPITLLNCDYKILARILNTRILRVLKTAAAQDNTGFVPGRSILDNTRLLTLLQAAVEEEGKEGAMIFLDFEKAFDTVSHELLIEAIDRIGFGPDFKHWIGLLYHPERKPMRRTVANGKRSAYWPVQRGVAQGCPLSPALYIVIAEALTQMANKGVSYKGEHHQIEGIKVGDLRPFRVSQFADDTVMMLANTGKDLETMWRVVEVFELGTGMRVNKAKTEGLQLGRSATHAAPCLFANTSATKYISIHSTTPTKLTLRTTPRGNPNPEPIEVARVHPSPEEAAKALKASSGSRHKLPFRALLMIPGPGGEPFYCTNSTEAAREILWCAEGDWIISLGVPIGRNFDPEDFLTTKIGEIRTRLSRWNGRLSRIPTASRVQLVNSLLLSKIWYWAPVLEFPKQVITQLTTLADTTIWAKEPRHDPLRTPSPGRWKHWIRKSAAGRKRSQGGLGIVDIPSRIAAAQALTIVRLFDHSTGRWKELLLHFLSRASRGAPYGRDLLLSTIPTSAIQRALSGPGLSFWRKAVGDFCTLNWQKHTNASPEALCSSLLFADRVNPAPTVRDPRVWERSLGIVRARDTYLTAERRFKRFHEVLDDWRVGRSPNALPKGFRKRNGFAELNGGGDLESRDDAMRRAEREWAAILTAVRASHGSCLLATSKLPEIGNLVAIPSAYLPNAQHNTGQWTYGLRAGHGTSNSRDTSSISRFSLGPNGLQAPHNSPTPIEVSNSVLLSVVVVQTSLGKCILGPESHTYPHPETWVLASRGNKSNPKTPSFLHSRKMCHLYNAMRKNAHQAPASEKKWEKELARTSAHPIPAISWPLIYRGTNPALLTPADCQQISKMVHRGIFTNAARSVQADKGCRLRCGRISNPVEHMSHLATCRKTAEVRLWALELISAIEDLPALPWAHGLVPFFCLGLAPPPQCEEGCPQGAGGCTCLKPLSAGGYSVLALTLRYLYAALTKLAIENLSKITQPQIITTIAEALRDRISSYFAQTKRRLRASSNRGKELDVAKDARGAAGNLLSADSTMLAIHPAAHRALQNAGVEMPRSLRWEYTPTTNPQPPQQQHGDSASTAHPDPAGTEETTQRGPEATLHNPEGGEEPTQIGLNPACMNRPNQEALASADRAAQGLLSRPLPTPPPRQPRARGSLSPQRNTPRTPPAGTASTMEQTPTLRRKRKSRQNVVLSQDTPTPTPVRRRTAGSTSLPTTPSGVNESGPRNGPRSPSPTPTPSRAQRRVRSPTASHHSPDSPASPGPQRAIGFAQETPGRNENHVGPRPAPAPPTTTTFPFRLPAHRGASSLDLPEIISRTNLEAALERLSRSEQRRGSRLSHLLHAASQRGDSHSCPEEDREIAALRRTALGHKTLHTFKAGARWDEHLGTTRTRYLQPAGVGRHIAQHTKITVAALGPGAHATASLGGCPREVRTLLTCHLMLDMDIANALPSIASQLDRLGLARSQHLEALHAYSQNRDACLNRIIERHGILPLDHESPRDIAKRLANSILFGANYNSWVKKYTTALDNTTYRDATLVRLQDQIRAIWAEVERTAGAKVQSVIRDAPGKHQKRQKQNPAYVFSKVLNEIEACVLHTASHFLHHEGWTVHSMQQDGILVRPPASLRPEQGDRPGRELVAAAEAALRAIAKQTMDSISKPPPLGLGLDITLTVKELYGIDPETILRSFD